MNHFVIAIKTLLLMSILLTGTRVKATPYDFLKLDEADQVGNAYNDTFPLFYTPTEFSQPALFRFHKSDDKGSTPLRFFSEKTVDTVSNLSLKLMKHIILGLDDEFGYDSPDVYCCGDSNVWDVTEKRLNRFITQDFNSRFSIKFCLQW